MCGIAGVLGRRADGVVRSMLARLSHRGPDDAHLHGGEGYTLGATRLSIIDVEGGRQPLANETGRVVGCQNGEIYDYIELRDELVARGHEFSSRTDTEVLVHGYEEWGKALPERLVGMFAVSVWDEEKREGLLARDRVGKKPLYYHVAPDGAVFFASEIKSLLEVPSVSREIDPVALDLFLSLKHVPSPWTIWKDVRVLPPGHRLLYRVGSPHRIEPYWSLDWSSTAAHGLSDDDLSEAIVEKLTKAVDRRLRSDVPLGFFLSGGVDSSLVAALAATRVGRPIHTFTLTYGPEATTPLKELDRRCARLVAERYSTIHVEETIETGDLTQDLPHILAHFDEPFSGVVSTYYLSRRITRDVKVALAGDGADEIFGSYQTHRMGALLSRGDAPDEALLRAYLIDPASFRRAREEPEWRWRARLSVMEDDEKRSLYTPGFRDRLARADGPSVDSYFRGLYAGGTGKNPLDRVLEMEFKSLLPDQVMAFVDRLSMAHSLEVRSPFLDQDLIAFVASIEPSRKIGLDGTVKLALKRAARRFLPSEVIDRPKEGFLMPINSWLAKLGPWVRSLLSPEALRRSGVFEPEPVGRLAEAFLAGDAKLGPKVFSLVAWQVFHDLYLEDGGKRAVAATCPGYVAARSLA